MQQQAPPTTWNRKQTSRSVVINRPPAANIKLQGKAGKRTRMAIINSFVYYVSSRNAMVFQRYDETKMVVDIQPDSTGSGLVGTNKGTHIDLYGCCSDPPPYHRIAGESQARQELPIICRLCLRRDIESSATCSQYMLLRVYSVQCTPYTNIHPNNRHRIVCLRHPHPRKTEKNTPNDTSSSK